MAAALGRRLRCHATETLARKYEELQHPCINCLSMGSTPLQPANEKIENEQRTGIKRILFSRWTFVVLQLLDLLTTLIAFRLGAVEVNPLVAHLAVYFGKTGGVIASKLLAIVIAMGIKRRIWIINLFYAVIIIWNTLVVFTLHPK